MSRLELPPRLVDWTILGAVVLAVTTGLVSLVSGQPRDWWVFVLHGAGALTLVVLLFWKFRRVYRRVTDAPWTRATVVSVLTAAAALATLGTGVFWVFGGTFQLWIWNAMNYHILFALLTVALLAVHLRDRFRLPTARDFEGRRTAAKYALLAGAGAGAWSLQQAANRLLDTAGADRRFTGSRPGAAGAANAYPVTMWMADDPDPVDERAWTLDVGGAVERPLRLEYDAVDGSDDLTAVLDCTGGWYAERDWQGIRVGRLLDRAGAAGDARYVRFVSVTGYRWSLPVAEAREALLATRVGGDRLAHGHGFPLRLVAPGRRGFQWVKWVERVEVRRDPDPGQWAAIFLSGFTAE